MPKKTHHQFIDSEVVNDPHFVANAAVPAGLAAFFSAERFIGNLGLNNRIAAMVACSLIAALLGCTPAESPSPDQKEPDATERTTVDQESPERPSTGMEGIKGSLSAFELLNRMVEAYQNAQSYADHGQLRLRAVVSGRNRDLTVSFMLAMERPHNLRLEAYDAEIVCNDQGFFASIGKAPGQVLQLPAPKQVTFATLFTDPLLAEAWTQGLGGPLPQVLLLYGNNPTKDLLAGTEDTKLLKPGEIDGHTCHRLRFDRPEGSGTFWIDSKTYVLRRLVMPSDPIRRALSREGTVESLSVTAEFTNARLNGEIDPKAFMFETPEDAEIVKYFLPPPMQMLGKQAPDLQFFNLDGKPVSIDSLKGHVVVLDFWATWCGPCRQSLPRLQGVYDQFKDNPKVAFFAVNIDDPSLENSALSQWVDRMKLSIPVLRDPKQASTALNFEAIPTTFIIGPKGLIQVCEIGDEPRVAQSLPTKINALLAGKDLYEESRREYEEQLESYARAIAAHLEDETGEELPGEKAADERQLPEVRTAPRSDPSRLKMSHLWKCGDVKSPGNVLIVRDGAGPARLLTVENWRSVAEVGLDGKLIALHQLELADDELVDSLRTAVGDDGKRYFLAFLLSQQRCHIFDENWKPIAHYPDDALENRHTGIADAEIGDLDGDGKPNVYVSYWGPVGVQGASIAGKRLWANRSVSEVACIAISGPDPQGGRELFCDSGAGDVVILDGRGERKGAFIVPNRSFQWLATADLRGDGRWIWCGIATSRPGENVAVGFVPTGEEIWHYPLPDGIPPRPIEPIVPGRVTGGGPGQWLLPAADGSIHIVSAYGVPFDKFNYGAELHGLATVEIDGRPAMIVASSQGLDAWAIDEK